MCVFVNLKNSCVFGRVYLSVSLRLIIINMHMYTHMCVYVCVCVVPVSGYNNITSPRSRKIPDTRLFEKS